MGLALEEVGRSLRRRAVVCVLSDFLSAQDGGSVLDARAQRALGVLARRHHLSCFLVNDPLEYALPSVGLVEMVDSETGQRQLVDSARVQPSTTVEQRVHALRRRGARVAVVGTDMDPFHQLICHFRALEHLR